MHVDVATLVESPRRKQGALGAALAVASFVLVLVVANRWGQHLLDAGHVLKVGVPPLHAEWAPRGGFAVAVAIVVGCGLLFAVPHVTSRVAWRAALATAFTMAATWTIVLNATRGRAGFLEGLDNRHEYLRDVDGIGSIFPFVWHFTANSESYATHTQAHPPGFVVVLWALDRVGLGGAGWAAVLCIGAGAVSVVAVLVAVRDVAGEDTARAALPFVALAPAVLWFGSSADAFFAAVGACAVAFLIRGILTPTTRFALLFGGALFGAAMLCSYGALLLVAIPGMVALRTHRVAALTRAGIAAFGVLLVAYGLGFNYVEGFLFTRGAYFDGVASTRPYSYALLANIAALAIVVGPATVVGITRLRGNLVWLVGGALVAVAAANLSGMSKLEVERIWLPFAVWLLPAAAALRGGANMGSRWLALQMAWALSLQTAVRTGW
ncbi:MAG: hypothetical protein ACT4OX_15010 [Actinomycetota bacterium]